MLVSKAILARPYTALSLLQMLSQGDGLKYIADEVSPIFYYLAAQQSIVAHSPDVERYKEFMKQEGHSPYPFWMPIWNCDELEELRSKRYPEIDHQLVGKALCLHVSQSCDA